MPEVTRRPLIIAFGFEARSGKGECCDTIYRKHSIENGGQYDILRISFAQRLRDEIHEVLERMTRQRGLGYQEAMKAICKWAAVEYDPEPLFDKLNPFGKQRKLQQWWGTEYRRAQDSSYWVNYVDEQIKLASPDVVLIDDLRFPNEHDWVTKHGTTVRVSRVGLKPIDDGLPGHSSEGALANHAFDHHIIVPDGNVEMLRIKALHVFDYIIHKQTFGW